MIGFVAHGEQAGNTDVRHLRRPSAPHLVYHCRMKLRIKKLREERGWTVETLAGKVNMSRSYVSEIENGKKNVNNVRLSAFAKAFGVSVFDLIDDASVSDDILDHIARLSRLNADDRGAVIRHAIALDPGRTDE